MERRRKNEPPKHRYFLLRQLILSSIKENLKRDDDKRLAYLWLKKFDSLDKTCCNLLDREKYAEWLWMVALGGKLTLPFTLEPPRGALWPCEELAEGVAQVMERRPAKEPCCSPLDAEFYLDVEIARQLLPKLTSPAQLQMSVRWMKSFHDENLKLPPLNAARNLQLQCLMRQMARGYVSGHFTAPPPLDLPAKILQLPVEACDEATEIEGRIEHWSPDGRTFMSAQPIPGRGALVYMATCRDPSMGWDIPSSKKQSVLLTSKLLQPFEVTSPFP